VLFNLLDEAVKIGLHAQRMPADVVANRSLKCPLSARDEVVPRVVLHVGNQGLQCVARRSRP
jgi:hypothetical protein